MSCKLQTKQIPAAAQSKGLVCGHSLAGIAGSSPARGVDVCLLVVLCVVRVLGVGLIIHPEKSYRVWCV